MRSKHAPDRSQLQMSATLAVSSPSASIARISEAREAEIDGENARVRLFLRDVEGVLPGAAARDQDVGSTGPLIRGDAVLPNDASQQCRACERFA